LCRLYTFDVRNEYPLGLYVVLVFDPKLKVKLAMLCSLPYELECDLMLRSRALKLLIENLVLDQLVLKSVHNFRQPHVLLAFLHDSFLLAIDDLVFSSEFILEVLYVPLQLSDPFVPFFYLLISFLVLLVSL
jgi:hypothetical protein